VLCPECGSAQDDAPGFRVYPIAVPLGFRTDFSKGKDAKEEGELLAVGAANVAESDSRSCSPVPETNTALAISFSGRVFRVNDRRGERFRGAVGHTSWATGSPQFEGQWIDDRFQGGPGGIGFGADSPEEAIALVAPKTTDLLRVRPASTPAGICLDPAANRAAVKAAYYSAAFIVRAAAAERLDIDPDELDISNVRRVEAEPGNRVGEIVISDHLANGAGFAARVAETWSNVLGSLVNVAAPENTFPGRLISAAHRSNCDASCYDCLRQYRNMSYHGLLDWRLGLSLLRVLASSQFRCGVDGDFGVPDLDGWADAARSLRDSFCDSFNCTPRAFGPLPGFETGPRKVVIIHPLWDWEHPVGLLAAAQASVAADDQLQPLDTFNILRRPSWAYQSLAD
jgi:DEAD/DEAH box helicase domain-containing protein